MVWAQSPGMDGIVSPSSIPLGLVLFDIWIQVSVLADLIQDVIDSSVVYLVLCHICLGKLDITVKEKILPFLWQVLHPVSHFVIRSCILRIITIGLDCYGFPDDVC